MSVVGLAAVGSNGRCANKKRKIKKYEQNKETTSLHLSWKHLSQSGG
jgi:hypothetical protein